MADITLNEGAKFLGLTEEDFTPEELAELEESKKLDAIEVGKESEDIIKLDTSEVKEEKAEEDFKFDEKVFENESDPKHKIAKALLELISKGDPVRDEKHPLHKIASDNQKTARQAMEERAKAERDAEFYREEFRRVTSEHPTGTPRVQTKQDQPQALSYEEAVEEGTVDVWVKQNIAREMQAEHQRTLQAEAIKQAEKERQDFLTKHPEITDIYDFEKKWSNINYDQAYLLDHVTSKGGIEKLLADAREEGRQAAFKERGAVATKNAERSTPLNNGDGTPPKDVVTDFKILTAEQYYDLSETEAEKYVKNLKLAAKQGKIPNSPLLQQL